MHFHSSCVQEQRSPCFQGWQIQSDWKYIVCWGTERDQISSKLLTVSYALWLTGVCCSQGLFSLSLASHPHPIFCLTALFILLSPNYRPLANFPRKRAGGLIPRPEPALPLALPEVLELVFAQLLESAASFWGHTSPFLLLSSPDVCDQRQPQGLEPSSSILVTHRSQLETGPSCWMI